MSNCEGSRDEEKEWHVKHVNEFVGDLPSRRRHNPIPPQGAAEHMTEDDQRYGDALRNIDEYDS